MIKPKLLFSLLAALTFSSSATPLRLDYAVAETSPGLYTYDFSLVVDNNDSSFASGQGWNWIIFGDVPSGLSPINDFVLTSTAPAPFTSLTSSGGGHNGPTFFQTSPSYQLGSWYPTGVGDSLVWSGTSATYLGAGALKFSTHMAYGGAIWADFEVANLLDVPEFASSLLLSLIGAGSLFLASRKIGRSE